MKVETVSTRLVHQGISTTKTPQVFKVNGKTFVIFFSDHEFPDTPQLLIAGPDSSKIGKLWKKYAADENWPTSPKLLNTDGSARIPLLARDFMKWLRSY